MMKLSRCQIIDILSCVGTILHYYSVEMSETLESEFSHAFSSEMFRSCFEISPQYTFWALESGVLTKPLSPSHHMYDAGKYVQANSCIGA